VKAEATVACGGKTHRIEVTDKGRLRLCDHPRRFWKTLEMQQAIGMECACAEVLRAWRDHLAGDPAIPKRLRSAADNASSRYQQHCAARALPDLDELAVPLRTRLHKRVQRAARKVFIHCDYARHYNYKLHSIDVNVVDLHGRAQCDGGIDTRTGLSGGPNQGLQRSESWWSVTVRLSWLTRVHATGLATVGGRFVLDAKPYSDRIWQITYVDQGSKYKLVKRHGFAVQQPDGSFTLARHHGQVQHVYR
jgi:hypothetical protein